MSVIVVGRSLSTCRISNVLYKGTCDCTIFVNVSEATGRSISTRDSLVVEARY